MYYVPDPMMNSACTTINTIETKTSQHMTQEGFRFEQFSTRKEIFNSMIYKTCKLTKANSFMIRDYGDLISKCRFE